MDFTEELMKEWIKEKTFLEELDPEKQSDLYKAQQTRVMELEKRLTDLSKAEIEVEERAAGRDMDEQLKLRQIEADTKNQKKRNIIEMAKIGVPTAAAFVMGLISMKWEKLDTLTSTAGRNALRDLIKFRF